MSAPMRLIWKLLRKHISVFELAVFFVANLIGMAVILAGVQIYSDIKPMLTGEKSLIGNEYMIVTRPVERVGIGAPTFSAEDIADLEDQDFVVNLGLFAASQFEVDGSIMFNGRRLSTMMFFEAVPDSFIDVTSKDWHFEAGDKSIPIILPRNYLNLYNFGFSQTQKLPQITEDMIKRVELGIRLSGNGHRDDYVGRVVGFSDRLNTILVPMDFITWANSYYAEAKADRPTRLILEVANPGAPEVTNYLAKHGYAAEDKPAESSKALFLLKVCVAVIVGIGAIFSLLSMIILTLSIYLLLQKNITKLENLVLIGHKPSRVAMPYNLMTLILNLSILVISLAVVYIAQGKYIGYLSDIAGHSLSATPTAAVIVGILLTLVIVAFNFLIIYRKIREISKKR